MSAASGEPEVQRYDMGWNADAHDDIVPCEFGTFVRYADYLTLAQQRDAAVRERESALELAAADERRLFARIEEVRTLRARLAACEGDSKRLDWLEATKEFSIGAPYTKNPLWFVYVDDEPYEGAGVTLRDAIDATMARDDFGPNDGHARTVRRTPPQDAATTRGEGV